MVIMVLKRIYFYCDDASHRDSFKREHKDEDRIHCRQVPYHCFETVLNVNMKMKMKLVYSSQALEEQVSYHCLCAQPLMDDPAKHYADSNVVTYLSFH